MKCKDCKYCVPLEPLISDFGDSVCVRYPPVSSNNQAASGSNSEMFIQPVIHAKALSCGEFKKKGKK